MPRALGYIRVSTNKQLENTSLEKQEIEIKSIVNRTILPSLKSIMKVQNLPKISKTDQSLRKCIDIPWIKQRILIT